ncbi:hypothetical protein UlMin_042129 [Ulmus minor]
MAPRKYTRSNKTAEITQDVNNLRNMVEEQNELIRGQARLLEQLVKERQDRARSSSMSGNPELVELRQMMVSQTKESRGHARIIETLLKRLNDQEQQKHGNNDSGVRKNPRNGDPVGPGNGNLNNQLVNIEPLYERFRKQHPPIFEGSSDPLVAEEWLRSIEDIFNFMRLNDHERVLCAIYMLRKDARFWWDVYFHPVVLQGKVEEFNNLCQGNLSVTEAIKRFDQLARLVPHLVTDERERVRRMMRMFRPGIMTIADAGDHGPQTVAECIDRALHAEFCEKENLREQVSNNSSAQNPQSNNNNYARINTRYQNNRGRDNNQGRSGSNRHDKRKGNPAGGSNSNQNKKNKPNNQSSTYPTCPKCGKLHPGQCRLGTTLCYTSEAEPSTVVSGQLIVASIPAYVLIDSGATHSFASEMFAIRIDRCHYQSDGMFSTTLPSGEVMLSTCWLRAVPMIVDDRELFVNLIVLDMHDFDVILGMDWLSKYNATIDCRKRRVIFEPMGEEKFKFVGKPKKSGTPIISALKAKKMLSNGCVGYLAHVVDTTIDAILKPEDVHVVRNFLEVFPEDLPSLPLDREIEFKIELLPGTSPISKAPYRMAPAELKELKE